MTSGNLFQTGARRAAPAGDAPPLGGRAVSCLLIDDSKYDRQRLRRVAGQTGLTIDFTEAADLDGAISALRTADFDVILMDQMLPDGEGTTVAELFKNHLGASAPPIIMVSGSLEEAMPVRARASGCAGYISKDDLTPHSLRDAVVDVAGKTVRHQPRDSLTMAEHKAALHAFADATAVELRSQLTVALRLVARAADRHAGAAADLGEIREVLDEIWDYLDVVRRIEAERAS